MEVQDQLTEEQLNEILESGDPEAMEAALAQLSETEDGFEFKDDIEEKQAGAEGQDGAAKDVADQSDNATDDTAVSDSDSAATEAGDVQSAEGVVSKDGKHVIPYSVLEQERKRAQDAELRESELKQQLAEEQQKESRAERQLQMLTAQLQKNGLDPEVLPEDFKLTDEMKDQLVDDFGQAGKALVAMYARMEQSGATTQQPTQSPQQDAGSGDPLMDAIARNETLEGWRTGNTAAWETAVSIDNILQKDPKFADSSLDERFAEAVKRTQAALGLPVGGDGNGKVSPSIDEAEAAAEDAAALPSSLSALGTGGANSEKSLAEQMVDMSGDELTAKLEGMTEAQREAVLADIGF